MNFLFFKYVVFIFIVSNNYNNTLLACRLIHLYKKWGGWISKNNTVIKAIKHNIEHSPYNFILWEPLRIKLSRIGF